MIKFIWKNWWRNKERFILLIVGALIVSAGLTYLVGLSEVNKSTVVDELQQRWSASYDIVVRPQGSRTITEEVNLLEPNYLSGLNGGISLAQYEKIKAIPEIEVAAPIAMIGSADYPVKLTDIELEETGIYRVHTEFISHSGVKELSTAGNSYDVVGDWDVLHENLAHEIRFNTYLGADLKFLTTMRSMLFAGIDPEQEAKLVGLDESIIELGGGRYFTSEDHSTNELLGDEGQADEDKIVETTLPVIISNFAFTDKTTNITIERLDLPINREIANDVIDEIEENGGSDYLDTVEGKIIQKFSYTDEESFTNLINSISGVDIETGEDFPENHLNLNLYSEGRGDTHLLHRPSPLQYQVATSPFPDRWPFAYQIETYTHAGTDFSMEQFRPMNTFEMDKLPRIKPKWIGFYDPLQLTISKDPTNELPMETYRPATAELVLDANQEPVNPPVQLKPIDDPFGFLTNSPTMLTTIEAAANILGDEPISSIRIKVAGVSDLTEESQKLLEQVAKTIENETGLLTDITLGSSPQPALTHVPAVFNQEELGWIQQPWVKIGSAITIFRETKIGYSGLIVSVIAVAIVYVWASSLVSLLARRKEFAVLLAVGWRPNQLSRLLFLESTILGLFVATVAWMMLGFVYVSGDAVLSPLRFLLTGVFGFIVYLLGAVIPALLARNISPYETMRTGEISNTSKRLLKTKGLLSMAFNHFIGKWRRSLLSVVAISLPTSLLALFLYITIRLKGVMYTTWLGQYVALEVGPVHYIAMIVALVIAILTTAEIMWQNISERQQEIALLKAVGWKNRNVRLLILTEGMFSGLFAAVIGLSLALGMVWTLYGAFATEELLFILATGIVPIIIGVIGTIFPAEKAVRISPTQGMGGNYSNRKVVEKRLKWILITALLLLGGGLVYTVIQLLLSS